MQGNVILSNELARRYGDSGIISISLNPGNLSTDLQRSTPKVAKFIMKTFILYPPEFGVLTQLWAGTSPEAAHFNGKYLKPWAREGESSAASRNREYGEELWNWMEEQVQHI
ncbi:short-chain alcohol dehydrogenase [Stygiomarasmius scandens]|uniref:Short-chain alcohol dehydrogenase n=1 Tax=Marasmiellus scandens TaxID=2682957 RepID=A0ABR1IN82_9AGAR